jgi:hypothetical protein
VTTVALSFLDTVLDGAVTSADTRIILVGNLYAYDPAHANLDDVTASARLAEVVLTGMAATDGIVTADPVSFSAVPVGDVAIGMWVYVHTGVESTSSLVAWIDRTADTVPIAIDTNDGDIEFSWLDDRIFKI